MGNECVNGYSNIYFGARKEAATYDERLYARESAAEALGVSPSTLASYELGTTKVIPVDKVVLMADLYRCPELLANYCKNECPIGNNLPIATESKGIEGVTLRMLQAFDTQKIEEMKRDLISIAADGKVKAKDKTKLIEILEELADIQYTISEMTLTANKLLNGKGTNED